MTRATSTRVSREMATFSAAPTSRRISPAPWPSSTSRSAALDSR
jgi:hypothetical protein